MKSYGKISVNDDELIQTELTATYHLNHRTGRYEFMSSGIYDLTGYTSTEINELGFENIVKEVTEITADDSTAEETDLEGQEAKHYSAKYLVITKDGKETWLQDKAIRLSDAQGNNLFSVGTLKRYTEADNLVDKFKYSNENIETVFDLANLLVLVMDQDKKIRLINNKACELMGLKQSDVLGKELSALVPEDIAGELKDNIEKTFRETIPPPQNREITLISKSGEPKVINYNNAVLREDIFDPDEQIVWKREEKIQEVIFRIIQHSNDESDLNELFHFIHSGISELMLAENFYIALYDEKNDLITFPYFIDKYDKEAPPMKFGRGLTEYILRSGRAELITRERDDELVALGETEVVGTQSAIWLGVPLKIRDHTMGALVVQDYENEDTYTGKERQILEVVAYPISRAIERKIVEQERKELILKCVEG